MAANEPVVLDGTNHPIARIEAGVMPARAIARLARSRGRENAAGTIRTGEGRPA